MYLFQSLSNALFRFAISDGHQNLPRIASTTLRRLYPLLHPRPRKSSHMQGPREWPAMTEKSAKKDAFFPPRTR